MIKHLLVPLDGSRLAETALPAAAFLAGKLGADITLIHLIERNPPPEVHSEHHLTEAAEAAAYLSEVAGRALPAGTKVERHVHTTEVSNVARSLAAHAAELQVDLIVMCTHGRSGLRDLLFGSIAQQVTRQGSTPVLLIRPTESGGAPPFAARMVLVRLGDEAADSVGLPLARQLALACGSTLHLVIAIPSPSALKDENAATAMLMPLATNELLELDERRAAEYLDRTTAELRAAGLSATAEVARGDPAGSLINAAQRVGADLVVIGSRGRSGLEAFWAGSATPRLSGRPGAALLLVPLAAQLPAPPPPNTERA